MKRNLTFALVTVVIWSTMASVVKLILSDVPNMQALSLSSYLAALFLFILNLKNGSLKKMKQYSAKDYAYMCLLGFIGLFLYSALYYYGLAVLTSQEACILNYLWPMMLVMFSCIVLKEKMTVMKGAAMVCSFIGIIILSSGGGASGGDGRVFGIASCVAAAAFYGLFSVLNKKADFDQNISMMVFWLVAAVCSMFLGFATETWVPVGGVQWLGLLWLGVVVDAIAYLLWALALSGTENTAKIANLAYLTPFLSLIISAVFLKETVRPQALAALVFIIGGILLQTLYDRKK